MGDDRIGESGPERLSATTWDSPGAASDFPVWPGIWLGIHPLTSLFISTAIDAGRQGRSESLRLRAITRNKANSKRSFKWEVASGKLENPATTPPGLPTSNFIRETAAAPPRKTKPILGDAKRPPGVCDLPRPILRNKANSPSQGRSGDWRSRGAERAKQSQFP